MKFKAYRVLQNGEVEIVSVVNDRHADGWGNQFMWHCRSTINQDFVTLPDTLYRRTRKEAWADYLTKLQGHAAELSKTLRETQKGLIKYRLEIARVELLHGKEV